MNKKIKKAIMIRSKSRNKFLRDRDESNKKAYSKQIFVLISCVKLKSSIIQALKLVK